MRPYVVNTIISGQGRLVIAACIVLFILTGLAAIPLLSSNAITNLTAHFRYFYYYNKGPPLSQCRSLVSGFARVLVLNIILASLRVRDSIVEVGEGRNNSLIDEIEQLFVSLPERLNDYNEYLALLRDLVYYIKRRYNRRKIGEKLRSIKHYIRDRILASIVDELDVLNERIHNMNNIINNETIGSNPSYKYESDNSIVGIVLSGSTTSSVKFQLTELGERVVVEGVLVLIRSDRASYLARVDSLIPVNEFYQENDAFVMVRRKGVELPFTREIGKSYVISEAVLLGELSERGLRDIRYPPRPGDKVYLIDIKKQVKEIFGVEPGDTGIIWYGSLIGYSNAPVPLDVENITMHVGVFGITGSGKSYGVGYLIELLSRIPFKDKDTGLTIDVTLPMIVVDANGDYLDYVEYYRLHGELGAFYDVRRYVFPNSGVTGRPGARVFKINITLDEFTPREIAEFIVTYKAGGRELNELQVAGLERALLTVREEYGVSSYTRLFIEEPGLLYEVLNKMAKTKEEGGIHPQTVRAIKTALDKFLLDLVERMRLLSVEPEFSGDFIDWLVEHPSLIIIDFSPEGAPGVSVPLKQLIIGYITRILYNKFTQYKIEGNEKYLLFIIEEAQNYVPNTRIYPIGWSLARDYLSLIATQGRKFGLSLCLVSQRPSFIDPVVLSMINTFIIHRISPEDVSYVMKLSGGLPKSLERKLTVLSRGVAVLAGQMNVLGFPVLVEVGRRKVPHRMGATNVVRTLASIYTKKS